MLICAELESKLSNDRVGSTKFGQPSTMLELDSTFSTLFKLPKLEEKISADYFTTNSSPNVAHDKPTSLGNNAKGKEKISDQGKFPPVNESIGTGKMNLPKTLLRNLKQKKVPPTPRLNELITAVVETSRQLLGTDEVPPFINKNINKISISASHNHRKGKSSNKQKTAPKSASEKNVETSKIDNAENQPLIPTKFHSCTQIKREDNCEDEKAFLAYNEPPENVKEFLEGLPKSSHDDLVKNWIKKSSTSLHVVERKKKGRMTKAPIVSGRRPSVKVLKHLATRRCPRKKLNSNESANQVENLNAEVHQSYRIDCNANDKKV